jgi:hypothetical protein
MSRRLSLVFIFSFFSFFLKAQKEGNVWCFGDSALVDWNDPENPLTGRSIVDSRGSASSISDPFGNLLFYVGNVSGIDTPEWIYCRDSLVYYEKGHVYTKENTFMENGRCISGEGWYNEHTIVPMPGSDSLYYIFSVDLYEHPGINYSVVDMHANGGLGKVIERDVSVVSYTAGGLAPVANCIKAVRHGNGRDWWLLARTSEYNMDIGPEIYYMLILVTPNGIELQSIPIEEPPSQTTYGFGGFSSDGSKYYTLGAEIPFGNVIVYNFNRCTGELSEKRIIDETYQMENPDSLGYYPYFWSGEFSPNGRYLYANTADLDCSPNSRFFLFQYDLEEEFPALTRDTLIDYLSGNPSFQAQGGILSLAPDGKIYYSRPVENCFAYWWPYPDSLYDVINMNLSVINNPDSAFPACNYTDYSFSLGGARTYYGLPNNPNFALGAKEGSECDTLITSVAEVVRYNYHQLNIFPNPCYNSCQIQYKPALQKGSITITTANGKEVFGEKNIPVALLQHGYEINTSAFAKGVYFVKLVSGNQSVTKKLVRL